MNKTTRNQVRISSYTQIHLKKNFTGARTVMQGVESLLVTLESKGPIQLLAALLLKIPAIEPRRKATAGSQVLGILFAHVRDSAGTSDFWACCVTALAVSGIRGVNKRMENLSVSPLSLPFTFQINKQISQTTMIHRANCLSFLAFGFYYWSFLSFQNILDSQTMS